MKEGSNEHMPARFSGPKPEWIETARTAHVLMFCPVRVDRDIFELTAQSHKAVVDYAATQGVGVVPVYFDDNDIPYVTQTVAPLLPNSRIWSGANGLPEHRARYEGHNWTETGTSRIEAIRNHAIKIALKGDYGGRDYTHLFLVDADLVLQPETLANLVAQDRGVISEVFWSKWQPTDPWLPNVWAKDPYRLESPEWVTRLREPGTYQVGGLGACTLINRNVLELGVSYSNIPAYEMWGEDRHFGMRCAVAGVSLFASTCYPPFHIYRREMLGEATSWYAHDDRTTFFRHCWLDEEWRMAIEKLLAPPPAHKPEMIFLVCPGEKFDSLWVNHFSIIQHTFERVLGHNVAPFFGYSSDVRVTRNAMWNHLKRQPVTPDWVVWIDDDNHVEPLQIYKLIAHLAANPQVAMAAGWCWCSTDGYAMSAVVSFGDLDADGFSILIKHPDMLEWPSDVKIIGYTGFPLVVMRGSLLKDERMPRNPFLRPLNDKLLYGMPGEDIAFCMNVAEHTGQKILVDRTVKVPHLKLQHAEPLDFKAAVSVVSVTPESVRDLSPIES